MYCTGLTRWRHPTSWWRRSRTRVSSMCPFRPHWNQLGQPGRLLLVEWVTVVIVVKSCLVDALRYPHFRPSVVTALLMFVELASHFVLGNLDTRFFSVYRICREGWVSELGLDCVATILVHLHFTPSEYAACWKCFEFYHWKTIIDNPCLPRLACKWVLLAIEHSQHFIARSW